MTYPYLHTARYLIRHLKGNYLQATLNTIVGLLLVALDLAFVYTTKQAIDIATRQGNMNADMKEEQLTVTLLVIALIMTIRILLSLSSRWIQSILGVKAQNSMRRSLFARLLNCQWTGLRKHHTATLTNRLERDVADVVAFTAETIPALVTTLAQFIGAFLLLFSMDRTLACIVILILPFFILSAKLYTRPMRRLAHEARQHDSAVWAIVQETLSHIIVVKALSHTTPFLTPLTERQQKLYHCILRRTRLSTFSSALLQTGFAAGYLLTFTWGAFSLAAGQITYGAMLAFIQLVGQIQTPIRSLSRFVPALITSFTAAERLIDIEHIPIEPGAATSYPTAHSQTPTAKPSMSIEATSPSAPIAMGIRFRDVTFSYEPTSRKILHHFNFLIPPKQVTVILGETGAGKTTLIRLMLSLIEPTAGDISMVKASDLNASTTQAATPISPALRHYFSYVPQGNSLFSGTIRSNLLLAAPSATEQEMQEALHVAAIDTLVNRSPLGLDTPCGEAGDGLSEGQAQRIAIARGLLSPGRIKIFDEATSALDTQTEEIVLQRIVQHFADDTLIFITHRPQVLQYAQITLRL